MRRYRSDSMDMVFSVRADLQPTGGNRASSGIEGVQAFPPARRGSMANTPSGMGPNSAAAHIHARCDLWRRKAISRATRTQTTSCARRKTRTKTAPLIIAPSISAAKLGPREQITGLLRSDEFKPDSLIRARANADAARTYLETKLWPDGPVCPDCAWIALAKV